MKGIYVEALTEQCTLKEELQRQKSLVDGLEQVSLTIALLSSETPETSAAYRHVVDTLTETREKVQNLVG